MADALQLKDRDYALLRGLFESRLMTSVHAAEFHFDGKHPYAVKRIRQLKAAGLVGERREQVNEPSLLFLTRKGFSLLKGQGHLSELPPLGKTSFQARTSVSDLTLRHELDIMDVKAAFHAALRNSGKFSISEFSTWPLLYQFTIPRQGYGADVPVKPDGYIRIHEKEEGTKGFYRDFFLEVDRSHKEQGRLVDQAACYHDYYRSGGFAVRNGGQPTDFKEYPFRVLIVLKSAARRNNLAERLAQNNPPILTRAWLAAITDVTANPLGAIWITPADYRDALKGTPFYSEQPSRRFEYRPQSEREAFVEEKVRKLRLLEG